MPCLAITLLASSLRPGRDTLNNGKEATGPVASFVVLINFNMKMGAFAERIAVKADIAVQISDNMCYEDEATLGVDVITCGQGLFQEI